MALHIDYEIRWKNFRAFEDTGWIVIRPLTILIGPNNSGKSSILAPLLLMSQTMSSRDSITPLVTRGPLIDVGIFKDFIHKHDTSRSLYLGFRYHVHEPHDYKGKIEGIGSYPPGALEVTFTVGKRPEDLILSRFELSDIFKRPFLTQWRDPGGKYRVGGQYFRQKKSNRLKRAEREVIRTTSPVNFLFSPAALINAYHRGDRLDTRVPPSDFSSGFYIYINAIAATFERLRLILRDLSYVGPLRERPRRSYEVTSETPVSVGSRGEHTANLIRRRYREFTGELNKWIRRFEFGSRLNVNNPSSEQIFSLSFESAKPSMSTNIAGAGFGASQVLPLIVQALAAPTESLTIAEQPEIHLNPRLQCLLADLFVEMANSDHRIIVETHSEHLLLRLRRLVASGKIDHGRVAIYFVEKEDEVSNIRLIPLEANGQISAGVWPTGFFEETLKESLGLALAQPRVATKQSKTASRTVRDH